MKTLLNTLLATAFLTLTASASPALLVETTITQHHAKGGKDVLANPRITVESGQQAIIKVGKLEYAVTPTLHKDGTVELSAILTEHVGKNANTLSTPRVLCQLEQVAEIQVGEWAFTTKTSLVK